MEINYFESKRKLKLVDNKLIILLSILMVSGILWFTNSQLATAIATLVILMIYWIGFKSLRPLGFVKKRTWFLVKNAVVFTILIVPISCGFAYLIPQFTNVPLDYSFFKQLNGNTVAFLLSLPLVWIMGGFFEEVIFRGFLLNQLIRILGNNKLAIVISLLVTAVFFGFMHSYQGVSGIWLTGTIGLMLGIIFIINKRNLWINIMVHGLIDTVAMTVFYLGFDQYLI